jgi:type VI protein secretion system component VasF
VRAVTTYVARRLVERQRALAEDPDLLARAPAKEAQRYRRRRRWRTFGVLLLGVLIGAVALFAVAVLIATNS